MILSVIAFALGPIGRYVVGGLIIAALTGGFILKQRHNAVLAERFRVEQINNEAIDKATEARDAVRSACDRVPNDCLRDDNFRD